jgi:hypothetical protein
MRNHIYFILVVGTAVMFFGCFPLKPRYITEYYIKNYIEKHEPQTYSEVKIVLLYKGKTRADNLYMEVSAFRLGTKKGLVFGADIIDEARKEVDVKYYTLTEEEVLELEKGYEKAMKNIDLSRIGMGEAAYSDYSIGPDFFISIKDTNGKGIDQFVNVWIYKEKFPISSYTFNRIIREFKNY